MSVIKYKDSNGNYVKIPANVGINNVVEGYYNETDFKFYEESTYETEITAETNKIYISLDTDKSYYWDGSEYKLLSGGGSGHIIQDYESTDMTARTNLQFGESLSVDDDSENDATVVDEYELTNADIEEILSELPSPLSGSNKGCIPCGKVEAFYRETAPDGYLVCDGTEYAKADYPKLASILLGLTDHSQYEGSDSDHFKVPDLRGEFLRGSGTNSHTNQGSGAAVGEHQDGTELPDFVIYDNGNVLYSGSTSQDVGISNKDSEITVSSSIIRLQSTTSISGGRKKITSRPTSTSVLFCIAYKDIFLTTELPVLFDERSTEQPIGKYVRSDGKWKPVYKKDYNDISIPDNNDGGTQLISVSSLNIDKMCDLILTAYRSDGNITYYNANQYFNSSWHLQVFYKGSTSSLIYNKIMSAISTVDISIYFTKTNDEWR